MNTKKYLFRLLAVLFPLVVLAMVELTLWVFNAYPQPPLFTEVQADGKSYVQINSQVGERYFNSRVMPVPNLYPQKFSTNKPENTFRIFCMGGSTTAGFPYEMTVPFPQQLSFLLQQDYPDQEFEVINMGLSAINSFTVVDWMPEILKQDPDLILLYMGHNEFYGAYGTGSTISMGNNARVVRVVLKLQKLRLFQMIKSIIRGFGPTPTQGNPTLMEKVIDDKFIATNSILRMKTQENFASNLQVILETCKTENVPVILSNLVSNLKDQIPLDVSSNPQNTTSKANALYLKGHKEFEQGDTATAYISFSRARNQDEVPFRANENLNDIIHDQALRYNFDLVDMEQAFRKTSASGIPGNDLFSDHLHPNPEGYHLMATAFQASIIDAGLLPQASGKMLLQQPLHVTPLDWEIGSLSIFKLLHRWPFGNSQVDYSDYKPLTDEATTAIAKNYLFDHHIWTRAHHEMADYHNSAGRFEQACQDYMAIVKMFPDEIETYSKLVECAKQIQAWDMVKFSCRSAIPRTTLKGMFYFNLALAQRVEGNLTQAIPNIQKALKAPELSRSQSANIYFTYALFLLDIQENLDAIQVLEGLVREVPDFLKAQQLLKQLKGSSKDPQVLLL